MWFDSWADLLRIVLVGTAAYAALVFVLRVSGKRTLGQLNAFDFVVTVSLGSTLATILLSTDVSFMEGLLALALLAGLQFLVASVAARWPRMRGALTAQPVRQQGIGDLSFVKAVVLETNGRLSVISTNQFGDGSAAHGVPGAEVD